MSLGDVLILGYPILYLILALFGLSFVIFIYYYFVKFYPVTTVKSRIKEELPDVSVVVVVKDEVEYLNGGFKRLLTQEYPASYQVIVVNDSPLEDESRDLLERLKLDYPDRLYVTTILKSDNYTHPKRLAYTIGVKASKYDHIIFSDPKVLVSGDHWLQAMASGFSSREELVIGYSSIAKESGFLNSIFRCVNIYDSLMWLSRAVSKQIFRADMSNLGYTAKGFFRVGGYRQYLRLNSGENDLFVKEVGSYTPAKVVLGRKATAQYNYSGFSLASWFKNQVFNSYTTRYYRGGEVMFLFAEHFFGILFWLSAVTLLIFGQELWIYIAVGLTIVIRELSILFVVKRFSALTAIKAPFLTILLFDIFGFIYKIPLFFARKYRPTKDLWV